MSLHRSKIWKRRHSSKIKPVIHEANIPRLSVLLESSNPQAKPNASLFVERPGLPFGRRPSANATPEYSPITCPERTCVSGSDTSTSNQAPLFSPLLTSRAPPLDSQPANLATGWPPSISSEPAAAAAPTPAIATTAVTAATAAPAASVFPGTCSNGTATLQQTLVGTYGEAAFNLISLADWEKHLPTAAIPFEEVDIHPTSARPDRLPGLRALGLDKLYEAGQMGFITWRTTLFGPQYGRAGVAENSEKNEHGKNTESRGGDYGSHVRQGAGRNEDTFTGEANPARR